MVGNYVHDNLQALLVGLFHHCAVEGVVAETRVDMIVVGAGVAVVRLVRLVVQQQRSEPDGGGAEVGHIVEMVDNALYVTAVAGHRVLARHFVRSGRNMPGARGAVVVLPSLPGLVVIDKSRSEAVGHNKVDHVGHSVAFTLAAALFAAAHYVGILEGLAFAAEHEVVLARLTHLHVEEEVIGAVGLMYGFHTQAAALYGNVVLRNLRPLHKQLERSVHARPPGKGLHTGHLLVRRFLNCRIVCLGGACRGQHCRCRKKYRFLHRLFD